MDDQLANLAAKLAEIGIKNTASTITTKIAATKAKKDAQRTIQVLEEMVNELLADKNEVIRIARAYEQELVEQKISDQDIDYITGTLVPMVEDFINNTDDDAERQKMQSYLDIIKRIISKEMITVMQLIGFNFKRALGEPLTLLLQKIIESKAPTNDSELKRLNLINSNLSIEISKDAEATARLMKLLGRG